MGNTTIQLSNEMKEKIASFGMKHESYEVILRRMFDLAVKEQLRDFLMSSENCISLDDFEKEVNTQWPMSK